MLTIYQDPAQMPNQSQEQVVFDALWAQFLANMPVFCAQWNADLATFNAGVTAFNSAAAGMAYAIPYTIDLSSTADADPGAGKLRFNNATQNLATVLRLDVAGQDTADYTKSIDSFDASTSVKKGTLRIVKLGDARKFLTYDVTARAAPAGYRNITVTPVDSSAANPFVNGESVLLFFQRTGDRGDMGPVGTTSVLYIRDEKPSGTDAGSVTAAAWNTRTLNTVKANSLSGASVGGNQVTVPAGTYDVWARAPAYGSTDHKARLFNITDNAVAGVGSGDSLATGIAGHSFIKILSLFLPAAKTFELQHYFTNNYGGFALGKATGAGTIEVYAELEFRKVG